MVHQPARNSRYRLQPFDAVSQFSVTAGAILDLCGRSDPGDSLGLWGWPRCAIPRELLAPCQKLPYAIVGAVQAHPPALQPLPPQGRHLVAGTGRALGALLRRGRDEAALEEPAQHLV